MNNCDEYLCDQCPYCLYWKNGTCQIDNFSFNFEDKCLKFEDRITYNKGYIQGSVNERNKIFSKGRDFMADKSEKCKCFDCFERWLRKVEKNDRELMQKRAQISN